MSSLTILNAAIASRLEKREGRNVHETDDNSCIKSNEIQLSSLFMERVVQDVNDYMFPYNKADDKKIIFKENMCEFEYSKFGQIWRIYNREYRDDTMDDDIERILIDYACR